MVPSRPGPDATGTAATRRHPERTCVGCRRTRPTPGLVRVRADPTGYLLPGPGGRGAWLCADTLRVCCALAVKRRAFRRALRLRSDPRGLDDLCERLAPAAP